MADWQAEQDRKAAADTARQHEQGLWGGHARGGRLTAGERRAMPSKEFALPGHGEGAGGKGSGAYPIDTPGRARAALSRGSANASGAEFAEIRRKVASKYPQIQVSGEKKD